MVNRREVLAGLGLAIGGGTVAITGEHVVENYELQDPIDVDLNSPLRKKRDNGKTPAENHRDAEGGEVPSNVGEDEHQTEEPVEEHTETEEPWFETYDVDDFEGDLYDESDFSIGVTNQFLENTYDQADGEIYEASVVGDMLELNEGGANNEAHLYNDEPGLGYSEEFGDTIETLADEDELAEVLDDYVEDKLK
jgi:hypothetical protein